MRGTYFMAYVMAILKLQFWHITGWLEFAERGMKRLTTDRCMRLCSACHDEIDRRTYILDNKDARLYHLEGVIRTQAMLLLRRRED